MAVYYIAKTLDGSAVPHGAIIPVESLLFQSKYGWAGKESRFVKFGQAYKFSNMTRAWSFIADFDTRTGKDWFVMQQADAGVKRISDQDETRCRVATKFDGSKFHSGAEFIRAVLDNKRPVHFINIHIPGRGSTTPIIEALRELLGARTRVSFWNRSFTVDVTPSTLTVLMLGIPEMFTGEAGVQVVWTHDPAEMTLTTASVDKFITNT